MEEPLRVLLVEKSQSRRGIAAELLADYDLDFGWVCVASPHELLKVASDFKPTVVLCSEHASAESGEALLGTLRLLSSRTPSILVLSLAPTEGARGKDMTSRLLDSLRRVSHEMQEPAPTATARFRQVQDMQNLRECFSSILESSSSPLVMSDSDGWITYANTGACRVLGEVCGHSLGSLLDASMDPSLRAFHWLDIAHDSNRGNDQYSGPFQLTRRSIEPGLTHLVHFDAITGLPKPVHLDAIMRQLGARSFASSGTFALVALDLESARVSDEACYFLLAEDDPPSTCAEPPLEARGYGTILRLTPHDYLVALAAPCSVMEAAFIVQQVIDSVADPRLGVTVPSPSLPAAPRSAPPPSPAARPSRSLYRARLPSSALVTTEEKRPDPLGPELADALSRNGLAVQFQPQYDLRSGRGCGVEALARWTLCTGEIVPPSTFIPLAERSGMIHELGAWVLKAACDAAATWGPRTGPPATLSVNISALQIGESFCAVLGTVLKHSGISANQLELEITESALIGNADVNIEYLKAWRKLGVRVAVDDFGTGYSSLSYLSRLPIDRLKLDRSLIAMMTADAKSASVMRSIVTLGAELGIDVIAKGVETEAQLQMLGDLGCPRVQGYLLGRPMSAQQAQIVLRKAWGNRPDPALRPASVTGAPCRVH